MATTPVNEPTNLWLKQGAAFRAELTYTTPDGQPFDLTDYHAYMQARIDVDTPALIDLTDAAGITLGGTAGTIAVYAGSGTTKAIRHDLVYDLFIVSKTDPNDSECIFFGKIEVIPAITALP